MKGYAFVGFFHVLFSALTHYYAVFKQILKINSEGINEQANGNQIALIKVIYQIFK